MSEAEGRLDRHLALALVGLVSALFLAFLWLYVPRMNNYVMSDREFTGWTGPIAERLLRGERPYVDFVLPIPPGSMIVLAALQKLAGRPLLLQELWVAAISHWLMGLLAYVVAAPLTTRRNAVLVALVTLVLVTQTAKECVYDHTSLLSAWVSMAIGLRAMLKPRGEGRWLWLLTGGTAAFTLAFKQSTAVGIIFGWVLTFLYLGLTDYRADRRRGLAERGRDAGYCVAGGVIGLVLVGLVLLAVGSTVSSFVEAAFGDGPELKGGRFTLINNLYNFVVRHDAIRVALVPTAITIAIAVRFWSIHGHFHVGDEPERQAPLGRRSAILIAAAAIALFGSAIFLLAGEARSIERVISASCETLRNIPAYGFVFGTLFFFGHLTHAEADERRRHVGHAVNGLFLVAMTSSIVYDTSFIHFSPFYYNDPNIPVALLCLFVATERARLPWMTAIVVVASCLPLFGVKLNRALSADIPVESGHWAGMRVNYRGRELLKAAARVQALVGPGETALMLPEDVQFVGLMQRPRPPVKGAILFVDQYPRRLLQGDIAAIDRNLPKVIVIHPRRRRDWHTLYNTWSKASAAQDVIDHVLDDLIPKHYRLDSAFPTIYFWDQGQLDVWVRKD
jgi:hypothetical protein